MRASGEPGWGRREVRREVQRGGCPVCRSGGAAAADLVGSALRSSSGVCWEHLGETLAARAAEDLQRSQPGSQPQLLARPDRSTTPYLGDRWCPADPVVGKR
jgi:hypothetical protein